MTTKYETSRWRSTDITPVEIVKETDKTVWVKIPPTKWSAGRVDQRRKDSSSPIFDTYDEALEWLIARTTRRHESLARQLGDVANDLLALNRMKQERSDAA